MTTNICNLSTQEVETKGLLRIGGQFGLHYEILKPKLKQNSAKGKSLRSPSSPDFSFLLQNEPRASCILCKCSIPELHAQPSHQTFDSMQGSVPGAPSPQAQEDVLALFEENKLYHIICHFCTSIELNVTLI